MFAYDESRGTLVLTTLKTLQRSLEHNFYYDCPPPTPTESRHRIVLAIDHLRIHVEITCQ